MQDSKYLDILRRLVLLNKEGCNKSPPIRKEGGAIMMMDYITLAGFILAVLERKKEDEEHKNTSKNDRH